MRLAARLNTTSIATSFELCNEWPFPLDRGECAAGEQDGDRDRWFTGKLDAWLLRQREHAQRFLVMNIIRLCSVRVEELNMVSVANYVPCARQRNLPVWCRLIAQRQSDPS